MNFNINKIRQMFINFFCNKGHQLINKSSLIPYNDSTLLFTNSGMNQFKNIFLGLESSSYKRVVTSQYCIRAGGKHNDLEEVGYSSFHHTFFEMLGNFSFNDYFKYDAIHFAWELLTSATWFNIPKEKLWVTVHTDDNETYDIWANKIKLPVEHIIYNKNISNKNKFFSDNFWQMGDNGPCGPCSEIFYDYGNNVSKNSKLDFFNKSNNRYIELWNLVFIQFNRQNDGTLLPLPYLSIDTGMGLERIASVLQSVNDNYHTDLFNKLITKIAEILNVNDFKNVSLRVIADHIRSCFFLINENIIPSNVGRGYVLRRIIRRAIRHIHKINDNTNCIILYKLVKPLIKIIDNEIDKLYLKQDNIEYILYIEEKNFLKSMKCGLSFLKRIISNLGSKVLDGKTAFYLYDTYGLPLDITIDICRENNIEIIKSNFQNEMLKQRQRSHQSTNFHLNNNIKNFVFNGKPTIFVGYKQLEHKSSIIAILVNGELKKYLQKNEEEAIIILNETPFYAESGGQIGDCGLIESTDGIFSVMNTKKYGEIVCHQGKINSGYLKINTEVSAKVNKNYRNNICINHTATHILHTALRNSLGNEVKQCGSLVTNQYLRFDFFYKKKLTFDNIYQINDIVNEQIRNNFLVKTKVTLLDEALNTGAISLFREKYNEKEVRTVNIGDFSMELCGGTHVNRTGDIGFFTIKSKSKISSDIYRIEGLSGIYALEDFYFKKKLLNNVSNLLLTDVNNLFATVVKLKENMCFLEKKIKKLTNDQVKYKCKLLSTKIQSINNVNVLIDKLYDFELKTLYNIIDSLKNKLGSSIIILANIINKKANLMVSITKDITNLITAKEIVDCLIQKVGCKGGGKYCLAHIGNIDIVILPDIIAIINSIISKKLQFS